MSTTDIQPNQLPIDKDDIGFSRSVFDATIQNGKLNANWRRYL